MVEPTRDDLDVRNAAVDFLLMSRPIRHSLSGE